jgi:hypothetical protein
LGAIRRAPVATGPRAGCSGRPKPRQKRSPARASGWRERADGEKSPADSERTAGQLWTREFEVKRARLVLSRCGAARKAALGLGRQGRRRQRRWRSSWVHKKRPRARAGARPRGHWARPVWGQGEPCNYPATSLGGAGEGICHPASNLPASEAPNIEARKTVYERIHPETKAGVAGGRPKKTSANLAMVPAKGLAEATAKASGKSHLEAGGSELVVPQKSPAERGTAGHGAPGLGGVKGRAKHHPVTSLRRGEGREGQAA